MAHGTFTNLGLTNVDSAIDLVIAGEPGSTNDVLVELTVSATDADTGLAIPEENITLCGKTPTNGVVWVKFTDNSITNVTPTVSGTSNYTYSVTPDIYRVEIWTDRVVFFETEFETTPPDTNLVTSSAAAAQPAAPTPLIYRVITVDYSTNLTGKTNIATMVGAKYTLRSNPRAAIFSYQWEIGGETVANFGGDNSSGGPALAFPTNEAYVIFAWWKPGTNTVKLTLTRAGVSGSAECKFVVADAPVRITPAIGSIGLDDKDATYKDSLHFGVAAGPDRAPGMVFTHNGTSGQFQWVQMATSVKRRVIRDGVASSTLVSGLDTHYPYPPRSANANDPDDPLARRTEDSPIQPSFDSVTGIYLGISNFDSEVEVVDSFIMYLMFRPTGQDVWVPVRQLNWGWEVKATRDGNGQWQLNPNNPPPANLEDARATGYPSWNVNTDPLILQREGD